MEEKYAKKIAKELRLIRIELQKLSPDPEQPKLEKTMAEEVVKKSAGDKVTIR